MGASEASSKWLGLIKMIAQVVLGQQLFAYLLMHIVVSSNHPRYYIRYCLNKWTLNCTTIQDPLSKELDELDEERTLHLPSGHQLTDSTPELHVAAKRGDLERVKFLTDKEHQNPLQKDKYGDTTLHAAAEGGSIVCILLFFAFQHLVCIFCTIFYCCRTRCIETPYIHLPLTHIL